MDRNNKMTKIAMSIVVAFVILVAIIGIILAVVWYRTDWQTIDKANEEFIDSDGNHSYYDKPKTPFSDKAE